MAFRKMMILLICIMGLGSTMTLAAEEINHHELDMTNNPQYGALTPFSKPVCPHLDNLSTVHPGGKKYGVDCGKEYTGLVMFGGWPPTGRHPGPPGRGGPFHKRDQAHDLDACLTRCDKNPGCKGVTFLEEFGLCTQYGLVASSHARSGARSARVIA
ncbi:hypothetical protein K470DRAFT_92282 [Piedraia hortae CBS 480.64]|uniref:Apple domain-containing protein n=1 Tax=Piedraia hortae CBS 480.64 TaxID=1314780 RepID=A0A6A7BX96_9PEZI|nr:hypothetical protein K470DRAFT_92282 [Piedraia hortae CBS 480.64]